MTALRQCIETLGLDRRTCDFCMKCDLGYQERFDNAGPEARQSFVAALAAVSEDDFTQPLPVLGLITLLNETEFEDFITRLSKRAPFDNALAWAIIRLSRHGVDSWFVNRGKARFQRQFHLHPLLAPLLIQAAIRKDQETEDIVALFDCYESVAREHAVLRDALPLWKVELERRRQERVAREEREIGERLRLDAEQAEWTRRISSITCEGPAAILVELAEAAPSDARRFPCNWARISEPALRPLSSELLTQACSALALLTELRCWRSLAHKVRNALHTQRRGIEMDQLAPLPLGERLQRACDSRWSLTYFPDTWSEEVLADTTAISVTLRKNLLAKLLRLHRRGPWRNLRQYLLRMTESDCRR